MWRARGPGRRTVGAPRRALLVAALGAVLAACGSQATVPDAEDPAEPADPTTTAPERPWIEEDDMPGDHEAPPPGTDR